MHIEAMFRGKLTLTIRKLGLLLGALCLFALTGRTVHGQSYGTASGTPPFVSPEPVELGFTDAANGNLHLEISMGSYPQRASKQPLDIRFVYDSSSIWTIACGQFSCSWWSPYQTTSAWRLSTALVTELAGINCGQNGACPEAVYQDQWGTSRYFPLQNTTCPIPTAYASDSSGYQVNWCQGKVYAPDGTLVESAGQAYEDTNGNFLSVGANQTFDTLGRTIPNGGAGSTCGAGGTGTQTCQLPNSQGGVSTYTITTTTIPVQTEFGQSSVGEFAGSLVVPQSIALPDGTSYQFKYDCDSTKGNAACGSPGGQNGYYGLLTSVTLPTGGTVSYGYTKFSDSYSNKMEWFSSRTSASGTWAYSPQVISTCSSTQVGCQQKVTVTKPSGDSTVYTFTLNNGAWPVQVQSYGGGSLLSTVTNTYDFSNACPFTGCHGASYIRLLTTQTSLPVPGGGNITKQTQYAYDSPQTGNITAVKEWRYYSGSLPSTPDKETDTTYLSTGTNDIDKPLNVIIRNSSSSMVAQTLYSYDSYGSCPGGDLYSMTGVINHDDGNFGSGYTARGNPTQIQKWVSGSTYLTTQYCYDTTGQITEQIDPAGNTTGYGYADNFYNDNGSNPPASYAPNQKTNAYVTSVTPPIIGTEHIGYYYGSGSQALLTDQNGATTYDHFMDPFDRHTETMRPIGWSLQTYPSQTEVDVYSAVGDTSPSAGCTSCQHKQAFRDSWGRETQETLANAPGGAINLATTYDANSRVASQSHAYTTTSDPNYVFENYSYDGLDRSAGVAHPDSEFYSVFYGSLVAQYGGLSSQQGSTSTYGVGYPELMIDENGKKKQEWLDGFGRLIEVDEAVTTGTTSQGSFSICCTAPIQDVGTVYVTVGTFNTQVSYDENSTVNSVASDLASALNGSGVVTADASGSTVNMTSLATGTGANYSLSSYSEGQLQPPKFRATPSGGGAMTGGTDGSSNSTFYTYDALGDLTSVVQGTQTPRTFVYDGLGRKISESTPEAGTISVGYAGCSGDPGNLCSKTDARGITTTYTYDGLNRMKSKSYSNGQGSVTYAYDQGGASAFALGRLTQMVDPSGSETYTYDPDGDVLQLQKVVGSTTYTIGYQYNAGGELTQVTYPSGRVVAYSYDAVGRLCDVAPSTGCTASNPYATSYGYDSAGHVTGLTFGNGIVGTYNYFPKTEQLSSLSYAKTGSNLFSLNYWYQHDSTNCPSGTPDDDGPINCITDNQDSGRSATYTYDALNRLNTAVTNGSTNYPKWGLSEGYDQWSNRLSQTVTAGSGPQSSLTFNGHNQPTGSSYVYDASGDMTYDPATLDTYTYDAENRLTAVTGGATASYTYDADGFRVEKSANGTNTVYIYSGSEDIAEYDNGAAPSSPSREFIYGNGELLVQVSGGATTYYQKDHLSVRMITDASGNVTGQEGHFPFGEAWYSSNGSSEWVFTTYQHDQATGLEYALARYYDPRTAAFCSADPVGGDPSDPESWNRYAYARDNPINLTDPSGKSWLGWFIGVLADIAAIGTLTPELIGFGIAQAADAIGSAIALAGAEQIGADTSQLPQVFTTVTVYASAPVPWETVAAGLGGIGGVAAIPSPLNPRNSARFEKARGKAQQNLNNKDCQTFLQTQGVNPSDLKSAVNNETPWNGVKSGISEYDAQVTDPQDPVWSTARGITAAKGTTVSSLFQPETGSETEAVAQTPGNNVYFRPGRGITAINIIHEGLHNLTGLGDASLAQKLGLPGGTGSADINPTLKAHNCS